MQSSLCDFSRNRLESLISMSDRIVLRTGEALVAGGPPFTAAEPEVVIGELDGPVGTALATLTGDQSMVHSKVFAILNTDIQVRPVTLCVSKVTVKNSRYTNILMGTCLLYTSPSPRDRG